MTFTCEINGIGLQTIEQVARDLAVSDEEAFRLVLAEGLRRARAVQEEERNQEQRVITA